VRPPRLGGPSGSGSGTTVVITQDPATGTQVEQIFRNGVLVRTVQTRDVPLNFNQNPKYRYKWTYNDSQLKPNFFNMGPEAGPLGRTIGIVLDPNRVGPHYIGISPTDSASGAWLNPGEAPMPADEATNKLNDLQNHLHDKQNEPVNQGKPLDNNEIQTNGFDPNSVVGLVVYNLNAPGRPNQVQNVVNQLPVPSIPIINYTVDGNGDPHFDYAGTMTNTTPPPPAPPASDDGEGGGCG
jgi:hypothetical protein